MMTWYSQIITFFDEQYSRFSGEPWELKLHDTNDVTFSKKMRMLCVSFLISAINYETILSSSDMMRKITIT